MDSNRCVPFAELSRHDVSVAGGKGANLGDMVQAGLPIPPGFVIVAPAYREIVECSGLGGEIFGILDHLDYHNCEQLSAVEQQIREMFVDCLIPEALEASILESYRAMRDTDGPGVHQPPVAVRSSATAEDLASASFAGQQDTFLNVVGETALLNAVRRCCSSLFTSQAIFYRHQHGFRDANVAMAVVVQRMIDSEKSGVTFTMDPVMRNRYYAIIEAVWGLGEGIVSGRITPDHYKLDRETYELVYKFVPEKKIMICRHSDHGVQTLPVPDDRVAAQVLTEAELRYLVDLGNQIERHFGCPQDIEWAIEGQNIYLLQSRPITCL